jgi:hypothetical protein
MLFKNLRIILVSSLFCCLLFQSAMAQQQQRERVANAAQTAEITITVREDFFATFFESLFTNIGSVTYPLAQNETDKDKETNAAHASKSVGACNSVVKLEREIGGVKTAVKFQNGRIVAPIAFSGSYNVSPLVGCINFNGWADTVINLQFDKEKQILKAVVSVQNVNLNNVPSLANGLIVKMVQNQIDQKFNPIELVKTEQLSTNLPIKNNGALRLKATDVKPEITQGVLNIRIVYEIVKA